MSSPLFDCVIIGAGASGLFAASMLVKLTSGQAKIRMIDGNERCGKKLALTGSGRCNLSNKNASTDKYRTDCPGRIEDCLGSFGSDEAMDFFEQTLGVVTVCDNGLYYPATYRAATVIDSFRFYLEESGVDFKLGSKCVKIARNNGIYEITQEDGSVSRSKSLIFSAGGSAYPSTGSDGTAIGLLKGFVDPKDIIGFRPALTALSSGIPGIKALAGIRCKGSVALSSDGSAVIDSSEGEIIFTKEGGISGICVMDISGRAVELLDNGKKPVVILNLVGISLDDVKDLLMSRRRMFCGRTVISALSGFMPRVLCEFLCRNIRIDPEMIISDMSDKDISALAKSVCALEIPVDGFGGTDKAQVSSGGIKLSCVDENMQYKGQKGLYITGEALNVDGRCGGYNLQWAWSSAAAAAKGAAGV